MCHKQNSLTSIQAPIPSPLVAKSVFISPSRALLHLISSLSSEEALHPDVGTRMDSMTKKIFKETLSSKTRLSIL